MKKSKATRLTALMFAAAGVGCMLTPGETPACPRTDACITSDAVSADAAYRALREGLQLRVSAEGRLLGDVDGSGTIDVVDIVALQRYLLGERIKIRTKAADIYADNVIDIFDLDMLKRAVLRLQNEEQDVTEPVTEPPTEDPTETITQPLYGPPEWFTDPTEDIPQPEYGPAWDETWPESTDPTEDIPQPVYGPVWDETEPESTDPVESLEPITEPQDVYGPPEWFDMTEPEDPTETTMETLYGPPIAYDEQ